MSGPSLIYTLMKPCPIEGWWGGLVPPLFLRKPAMKILIKIDSETAARLLAEATPNITEQARDGLRDDGRRALIRAAIERRLQA